MPPGGAWFEQDLLVLPLRTMVNGPNAQGAGGEARVAFAPGTSPIIDFHYQSESLDPEAAMRGGSVAISGIVGDEAG